MNLFDVYPLFDIEPVRGDGSYVFDAEGNAYLDLYGGHAVISIGHNHPHFNERVQDQLHRLPFYSNSVQNKLQVELAHKLGLISGLEDFELFLCNSGAEANENALKMASFRTGKSSVLSFKKAFHGRTSAAVNITDNRKIVAPINRGFHACFKDWNDLDSVAKELSTRLHCAVIVEGIQGIAGIHEPSVDILRQLRAICTTYDTLLIVDEIQSGYGRSGDFFAYQRAGIEPDLVTVAKGMGNGFPIGGVLINPRFEASYGLLGSTFGGNHLACAAGLAVLEVIKEEKLLENAAKVGEVFKKELKGMPGLTEIRGRGLMLGLQFDRPIKALRQHLLYEEKVFTGSAADPNTMRLLPPLNLSEGDAVVFSGKLERALQAVPIS